MFRRSRGLARGNGFLHRLRVAYARSLTFAGLGTGTGFFQLRINANLREEKFQKRFAKSAFPRESTCGKKVFMGGAASCRSIFVIFSRKLKAPTARQNTGIRERGNGGNGNFLTQIPQIAQIFWEERHLAAPFLLFFPANSKR